MKHELLRVGRNSLNGNEHNVLFRNVGEGGALAFEDVAYVAGADRIEDARAVGVSDLDADGDLDLIVQTVEGPTLLLVCEGDELGNALEVRLTAARGHPDALGARVEVRIGERWQVRELTTSAGYLSGQPLACSFGLCDATRVDELRVTWPGGGVTTDRDVDAGRVRLHEEHGLVRWRPHVREPGGDSAERPWVEASSSPLGVDGKFPERR